MENKPSMSRVERLHREKVTRYSIRKYSFGAASVAVAALFMFLGNGAVSVQADQIQPGDTATAQPATPALDKTQLESYISEVKSKLSAGKYANKTEESLALLNGKLASAESVLASATTQDELTTAYQKLVMFVSSGLKNKPKEAPKVDTTNGQPTVGKKAENTEPKSDSNSIENTGSNDARNGKELDKNNAFRTEPDTEKPKVSIDYDDAASRTIWVTPTEETNITGRIKITDNSGKIVKGWMQKMGSGTETDIGYGLHNSNIDREATATADHPATLSITGKLQDRHPNGNPWTNGSTVVSRKVRAKDASNNEIDNEGSSDPATYQVFFKVRSQNVKYTEALANKAANFDKVAVANPAQLQQPELDKIKDKLQEGDGNNLNGKIATVTQSGDKVVITYNDGTTAERPVTDFARVNEKPVAEIPYSLPSEKKIFVYNEEDAGIEIPVYDESGKIRYATVKQGSNQKFPMSTEADNKVDIDWGYSATVINRDESETAELTNATQANPAKIIISGKPSDKLKSASTYTKNEAQTVNIGTRFVHVEDEEGLKNSGDTRTISDPGYMYFVLKSQTYKYHIQEPESNANKIAVSDIDNLTDTDIAKIKNKIKIVYSKTSEDARFASKKGEVLENQSSVVKSINVDTANKKVVVTYNDDSTDEAPISNFARTNEKPVAEIPYSLPSEKKIFVYNEEDAGIEIPVYDESGKIRYATVKQGSNQKFPMSTEADNKVDIDWGYSATVINRDESETAELTNATQANPAKIIISGKPSDKLKSASTYTKNEAQTVNIGTRFVHVEDEEGLKNSGDTRTISDPGYMYFVLKSQTYKYHIQEPESNANKIAVSDIDNLTDTDIAKIKNKIKIVYSKTSEDARFASKKGEVLENQSSVVKSINVDTANKKVVVTYNDDSTDEAPISNFARTNPAPTVELPYSNPDKKQIYVYTGENTDLTFKASDDAEVKDLYLRGPGGVGNDNTAGYGFTTGKIDNDVVTNGEGKVSDDKRTATIKMTGVTTLTAPNQWTSFVVANDNDNASSFPAGQNYDATTDDAVRQQKPGYVQFIVKNQTSKYDIAAPTEKVAVTDPANVTEAELEKIKEKLQIEYSNNNDDANLADKKGKTVDAADAKAKIASVTKDDQGNLVVTYTDGSTDKKPLSEFVTLDKQPAINEVNKAAEKQIEAINNNPEATKEEKDKAIEQVNADKAKALEDIANSTATTKPELDKVEKAGTDKIKTDNPVLSKKPAAKQAIDDALAAKNKAIDARPDLTPEEKTKAKEAAKAAADKAKEAVDAAKTNADVDTAAGKIGDELKKVNPVAKEAAKKAIADELAKKEKAIDARTDLTKEEKDAAKKEAQDKAKEATDAINKQPDIAETPEKATEAQTAVDGAKDKGVADVKAVNPVAAKKAEAKQAIDDALTAKNQEIDARTDLTPEEKTKAKEAAKAQADVAKGAVDAATTNAAVDKAKADGTTAVANVTPVAKAEAKKAINDALTAKNKEIDARTDLTDEEKTAAKNEAKDKADAQLAKINEQPDAAATPTAAKTAQDAVDAAKKTGVDEVTAVNPEAVKKPAAKKAIDDALKAKEAAIDARPDLTDDEKKAAKDVAKAAADKAKEAIDAAPSNAAVDAAKKTGVDEVAAVNPEAVKKPAAKKAIDDALAAKNKAIDARPDLTPEEKTKAKEAAKAAADKAKEAVDAATTDAEVTKAKEAGTKAVADVTPVAKAEAKKAIAKALEDKNSEIDKRTDLTDEEKTAAKNEAKDKADAQLAEIAKQPDAAATPEAAQTAQTAVDGAKDKGVADVKAVNPVAAKKPEAKEAVDAALKAKVDAINAREDLTPAEKDEAKKAAEKAADDAKKAIDAATTDAAVDAAKNAGTGEVAKVNPVAKEKAKEEIAKELAKKEEAIDERKDLTDEEKAAAKEEAQAKAKEATDAINDQPANAETPEKAAEAQKAVDGAKAKGVADVKAVNPEAVTKPAAKKAIEDKLAKQLEDIANTPDATDEEKKVAADAAKAQAEEAKEEIDKAGTDADVKQLQEAAEGEIEKSVPVVEDKPNARKAIDEEATAKKAEIDARNDLTPEAKAKLKAKVDKAAEKSKAAIDAVSSVDDVNTIEEADKAAIKAIGEVNRPIDKVLVKDPSALTDEEKAKILEEVKKVNPTAKEVKYDENGNIEVTTEAGDKGIINPTKLVKTEDQLDNGKGGNDINKPLDKVIVKDPSNLTDEEKAKIVAKVEEVNPDAIVTIDENGTVSVSTPEGKTAAIPASELVRTKEDTSNPDAGNSKIVKPADKVAGEANDPDDQAKVEEKLRELNPETKSVKFDEDGNATVTLKDGTTATIPSEDLFKSEVDATKPNAGNDIVKPADKTVVANPEKLTDAEKKAIEDKVKAVNPDATVVVDDKGNATVTTPEGKTAVIPAADLTKDPEAATKPNAGNDIVKPADKTAVANPEKLTDAEKKAIEDKVKAVNPDATVVVDDKGNATVTTPEGKTAVIPAADLTKDPEAATKPNAGNDIVKPADKTVVANPEKLTDAEKKAIEDKVKAVNPDATVVVDDKGNATVTTPEGKTAVIPAADLTKDPEAATKPNAGNDIVKPADKTVVANPEKLTDAEKKAIEDKVKAVNPDATVVVDDKGNATVTTPEGKTAVIPAADLTKDPEAATKPNAGNDIVKPADKTVVANPEKLTDAEKKAIEDKVKAVNPDATVVVDDKGNATVTTPEGKTAVIPAADLTKDPEAATKPNAGNDIVKPADKTVVANPEKLTDAEKKAIEDKVKAVNPDATVVVDDKGNATVTPKDGEPVVIPAADLTKDPAAATKPNAGNDIVKPADKTVVANPEKLTDAEKKAIEDKVKAVNPDATVVVDDKGNATVTPKDGEPVVIPAADLTKDPAAATKPNAGNAVNTPASKVEVKDPANLTDEEKAKVKKAIEAVNPGSKVVVDDKGNATVTTPEGNTAVIPAADVTKSAADADKANAGNAVNTPAAKTVVKDPANLTDAEKKAIEDKVKAVNPGSKVVVDDKGNATVTTPEGKTATIPATDLTKSASDAGKENAGNGANTPATKTVVKDPANLTDEEKAKVKKAVEAVNPGVTVVVDEKGNATVTKADGTVLNIPASDLVIPADNLADEAKNAKVKTPVFRTLVENKENLTKDEKEAVKKAIEAVNSGATVVVDEKGNATVTMPDGYTATISKEQLVKDKEAVSKSKHGGDNLDIDLSKVEVADLANITPEEKAKFQFKVLGAITDVPEFDLDAFLKETDDNGNTVYTSKDGKVKITIDKDGNATATVEKDGKTEAAVKIDKDGNVTIVTKEGQVLAIPRDDAFKQRPYVPSNGGGNNSGNGNGTSGNNAANNTDAKVNKAKLEGAIHQLDELIIKESAKFDAETAKEANALSADAKKVFANADASQAEVDAMVKRIEGFMAKVASSTDHATPANDQAAQKPAVAPATAQAAANASQEATTNARKAAKELPNTGTADSTVAMVAAAASALLGLGLAGRRRKEDEEA